MKELKVQPEVFPLYNEINNYIVFYIFAPEKISKVIDSYVFSIQKNCENTIFSNIKSINELDNDILHKLAQDNAYTLICLPDGEQFGNVLSQAGVKNYKILNFSVLENFSIDYENICRDEIITQFLTRNIFDVIVNMRDTVYKKIDRFNHTVFKVVDFMNLSDEQQFDLVIQERLLPSVKLYLSWYFAKQQYGLDIMFLSY